MRRLVAGLFVSLFCYLLSVLFPTESVAGGEEKGKETLELYSTAAVLMDADTGRVLYGKNADRCLPMASTTKIMTCILALEIADPEEEVVVSAYAAGQPKVHLGMRLGETYRMKDLLYSLMLESHNDSAVAIAEHIGRNYLLTNETVEKTSAEYVAAFAGRMNEKAEELGCENTWFITPNGLDAEETVRLPDREEQRRHSTTARDLAGILLYCIRDSSKAEEFLQITRCPGHSFRANQRNFSLTNHNAFLQMMEGALSGKTGFTGKAGYCYVGALKRDGKTFVVALLGCGWPNHKTWKWRDTRKLMNYGLDHYEYRRIDQKLLKADMLRPIPVEAGQTEGLSENCFVKTKLLYPAKEWKQEILLSDEEELQVQLILTNSLTAPVKKGLKVGVYRLLVDGESLAEIPVVTGEEIRKIDFAWCFQQVLRRFLCANRCG